MENGNQITEKLFDWMMKELIETKTHKNEVVTLYRIGEKSTCGYVVRAVADWQREDSPIDIRYFDSIAYAVNFYQNS